jgi:hypothetical protein
MHVRASMGDVTLVSGQDRAYGRGEDIDVILK